MNVGSKSHEFKNSCQIKSSNLWFERIWEVHNIEVDLQGIPSKQWICRHKYWHLHTYL